MIYVALLRGINVGGKNTIDMKRLKATFERVGMTDVSTYINSGNVVFIDQKRTQKEIASVLEEAIVADFQLTIKVLIRSLEVFDDLMAALPPHWLNNQVMKSDVLFLWEEIDEVAILNQLKIVSEIDHVDYVPGALLWMIEREHLSKTGMKKLVGTTLYKKMTIRNVNTTRKIYQRMQQLIEE